MTPPIEEIKVTPENVKNLTDEELDIIVVEKKARLTSNLKDSKEFVEKIPEIDKFNYKIDLGLSTEQRESLEIGQSINLPDGIVLKEKDENGVVYLKKDLNPKEKNSKKKAYIWEIVSGMDSTYTGHQKFNSIHIGEQKFNISAVDILWLKNNMIEDEDVFKKIMYQWNKKNNSNRRWFIKEFFIYSGYLNTYFKKLSEIGNTERILLWNNSRICIDKDKKQINYCNNLTSDGKDFLPFGFSVRCVKNEL